MYLYYYQYFETNFVLTSDDLFQSGVLNRTFFMVLGDHGSRANDAFQATEQGRLEQNMPLLTVRPPPAFQTDHTTQYKVTDDLFRLKILKLRMEML